jgi:hypothetical protein
MALGRIETRRVRSLGGLAKFECKVLPGSNEAEAKLNLATFDVKTAGEAEDKAIDLQETAKQKMEDASVYKVAARNEATKVDLAMDEAKKAQASGDITSAGKFADQAAKLAENTVKLEAEAAVSTAISKAADDSSQRLMAAADAMKAGNAQGAAAELKLGTTRATTGASAKITTETDKLVQKGSLTVEKGAALATQVAKTAQASMQPMIKLPSVGATKGKIAIQPPKGIALNIASGMKAGKKMSALKGFRGLGDVSDFELTDGSTDGTTMEYAWKGLQTGIDWASKAAKSLGINLADVVSFIENTVKGCDFPDAGDARSKVLKEMYKIKYGMYPSNRAMAVLNGNYAANGTRRFCSKAAMNNLLDGKPEIGLTAAPNQEEIAAFYAANGHLPPGLVMVADAQKSILAANIKESSNTKARDTLIALAQQQQMRNQQNSLPSTSGPSTAMIVGGVALAGIVAYALTRRK